MDPNFLQQLLAAFGQKAGGIGGMVGGSPRMPLPMPAGTPYGMTGPGGGGLPGPGPMPLGGPQIGPAGPVRTHPDNMAAPRPPAMAGPTDPAFYGPGLGGSPQGIPPPQTHPAMYGPGPLPSPGGAPVPPPMQPKPPQAVPMPTPAPPAQAGAPPMPGKETYGGPWGQDDPAEQLRKWRMLAAMGGQVGQDMPGGLFGVAERSY